MFICIFKYCTLISVICRRQLAKKRQADAYARHMANLNAKASTLQKIFRENASWNRTLRLINVERIRVRRLRAAKKIQKLGRCILWTQRYNDRTVAKYEAIRLEKLRLYHKRTCNTIGFYYKRYKEKNVLKVRFVNRKRVCVMTILFF